MPCGSASAPTFKEGANRNGRSSCLDVCAVVHYGRECWRIWATVREAFGSKARFVSDARHSRRLPNGQRAGFLRYAAALSGLPLEVQQKFMRRANIAMTNKNGRSSMLNVTLPANARIVEMVTEGGAKRNN